MPEKHAQQMFHTEQISNLHVAEEITVRKA